MKLEPDQSDNVSQTDPGDELPAMILKSDPALDNETGRLVPGLKSGIRTSDDIITYFKGMADETGVPYRSLVILYLRDCVAHNRKPDLWWR